MNNTRNPYFDNIKGLLIILVIFGHLIEPLRQDVALASYLYKFIYSFHMPLFILISGLFIKKLDTKNELYLLGLYFVFQIFYTWLFADEIILFNPKYGLWYLFSLFLWRLWVRYITDSKYAILIALGLGLVSGYFTEIGGAFAMSRAFTFFVYFVIGYQLTPATFEEIGHKLKWYVALILLGVAFFLYIYAINTFELTYRNWWFAGDKSYQTLILNESMEKLGLLFQFIVYLISATMAFLVINVVPRFKIPLLNTVGRFSLYYYLTQIMLYKYLDDHDFYELYDIGLLDSVVITIVFILFMSSFIYIIQVSKPLFQKDIKKQDSQF